MIDDIFDFWRLTKKSRRRVLRFLSVVSCHWCMSVCPSQTNLRIKILTILLPLLIHSLHRQWYNNAWPTHEPERHHSASTNRPTQLRSPSSEHYHTPKAYKSGSRGLSHRRTDDCIIAAIETAARPSHWITVVILQAPGHEYLSVIPCFRCLPFIEPPSSQPRSGQCELATTSACRPWVLPFS